MIKISLPKYMLSALALSVAANGFCVSTENLDSYPIGRTITHQVEIYRAAQAVMKGYNNHVRAVKNNKNQDIAKSFAAISSAGILDIPFRFPSNKKQKELRSHILKISNYLVGQQKSYKKIRPDAAFCAFQNAPYLYPSVKFQKLELDETRREKIAYRAMRMCPNKLKKWR